MTKITRENYESQITKFGVDNLNETLKEGHKNFQELQEFYQDDAGIREVLDLYLEKLNKFITNSGKGKITVSKKIKNEPPPPKQKQKKASSGKKSAQTDYKLVESVKEEIKIIRRFVGLHNKQKSPQAVLNVLKALQKALVQKLIRKTSPFSKEIEQMQDKLVKLYNEHHRKQLVEISFDEKYLRRLISIVGGEKVYKSISIIKQYIGLQGNKPDLDRIYRLMRQAQNAIKKGAINSEDPYFHKVKEIIERLKSYNSDKNPVLINSQELNGLRGIVRGCSCSERE